MKRLVLFFGVPCAIFVGVVAFYLSGGRYVTTENAYVRSGIAMVSARTSGQVTQVFVQENQVVDTGDLLFVLDVVPFDLAVAQATTMLDDARDKIGMLKSDYRSRNVSLAAAQEDKTYAQRELNRFSQLTNSNAVSKEKISARQHALNVASNKVAAARAEIANAAAMLGGDPNLSVDTYPMVRHAQGDLAQAQLDRDHARITAGMPGIVAKLDLHPGEFVQKGQSVFSLVRTHDIWVEANLKETQLTHLKIGQTASFEIDAYPDQILHGELTSMAPASGAEFAILPPQNATGNWVKVTQRIPVRLSFDPADPLPPLRAGMSVHVSIDTGIKRTLEGLIDTVLDR